MNNYIQVEFDDVLGEPEGAHAAECVWKNSFKCFNCSKKSIDDLFVWYLYW